MRRRGSCRLHLLQICGSAASLLADSHSQSLLLPSGSPIQSTIFCLVPCRHVAMFPHLSYLLQTACCHRVSPVKPPHSTSPPYTTQLHHFILLCLITLIIIFGGEVMKLLIMYFSPFSCYLLPRASHLLVIALVSNAVILTTSLMRKTKFHTHVK